MTRVMIYDKTYAYVIVSIDIISTIILAGKQKHNLHKYNHSNLDVLLQTGQMLQLFWQRHSLTMSTTVNFECQQ